MSMEAAVLSRSEDVAHSARLVLEENSYFRGRTHTLAISESSGVLTVRGMLPSYYLRQVMGNLLCKLKGVQQLVDEVDVVNSQGLSSARTKPR